MVEWIMGDKYITGHNDFTDDVVGFIYQINYMNGQSYIGSKLIRSLVKLKPTKEQLKIRKNYVRKEWKDKPFMKYIGSSENTKHLEVHSKVILEVCSDKLNLRYCETKWLFARNVLVNDMYLNDNINGTYFTGKIHSGVNPNG